MALNKTEVISFFVFFFARNGPEDHLDLVDKMQKSLKLTTKVTSSLLKELAVEEAQKVLRMTPKVNEK
jgi:hypothetical protein